MQEIKRRKRDRRGEKTYHQKSSTVEKV